MRNLESLESDGFRVEAARLLGTRDSSFPRLLDRIAQLASMARDFDRQVAEKLGLESDASEIEILERIDDLQYHATVIAIDDLREMLESRKKRMEALRRHVETVTKAAADVRERFGSHDGLSVETVAKAAADVRTKFGS